MIGKIPFSVAMCLSNPSDQNSEKVARAYVQRRDVVTLEELAQHIKDCRQLDGQRWQRRQR